jgi:hypothetical protein
VILNIRRTLARWLVAIFFLARNALDLVLTHQAGNAVLAALLAFVAEILPDPRRTQDAITLSVQDADTIQQTSILSCSGALRPIPPAVIATG